MASFMLLLMKRYDLHKLLTKMGGVGGSFVASHLVALTATPDYATFWAKLYLTAPTITNVPAFEKMIGTYFALAWIGLEHFYWRISGTPIDHQRADDPPKGDSK